MLRARLHGRGTLCSTIQEIYIGTEDEDIKFKCRIAMRQSKMMDKELRGYRAKYGFVDTDSSTQ